MMLSPRDKFEYNAFLPAKRPCPFNGVEVTQGKGPLAPKRITIDSLPDDQRKYLPPLSSTPSGDSRGNEILGTPSSTTLSCASSHLSHGQYSPFKQPFPCIHPMSSIGGDGPHIIGQGISTPSPRRVPVCVLRNGSPASNAMDGANDASPFTESPMMRSLDHEHEGLLRPKLSDNSQVRSSHSLTLPNINLAPRTGKILPGEDNAVGVKYDERAPSLAFLLNSFDSFSEQLSHPNLAPRTSRAKSIRNEFRSFQSRFSAQPIRRRDATLAVASLIDNDSEGDIDHFVLDLPRCRRADQNNKKMYDKVTNGNLSEQNSAFRMPPALALVSSASSMASSTSLVGVNFVQSSRCENAVALLDQPKMPTNPSESSLTSLGMSVDSATDASLANSRDLATPCNLHSSETDNQVLSPPLFLSAP